MAALDGAAWMAAHASTKEGFKTWLKALADNAQIPLADFVGCSSICRELPQDFDRGHHYCHRCPGCPAVSGQVLSDFVMTPGASAFADRLNVVLSSDRVDLNGKRQGGFEREAVGDGRGGRRAASDWGAKAADAVPMGLSPLAVVFAVLHARGACVRLSRCGAATAFVANEWFK